MPVKQRRASKMAEGSTLLRHESCPQCGSKDNLARYSDGHGWCFGCSSFHSAPNTEGTGRGEVLQFNGAKHKAMEMTGTTAAIPERRISEETCRKFGVTVEFEGSKIIKHHYPFKDLATGATVASKVRVVEGKKFYSTGDTAGKLGLFGQDTCRGNGKFITITEGELDCLAVSEMFDRKYDVVSLRNGASSAAKEIKEQLEWLESYDTVVLCFDNDKAGSEAVEAVRDIFSPNRLKVCKLPLKDAGDMLVANRIRDFTAAWWDAKVYRPDGIVAGVDTWDSIINARKTKSTPYPWQGLTDLTRGMRPYELVTVTSGSGMGKSQFIKELEYYLFQSTKDNIGILALEESIDRSVLGLMSMEADAPLHYEEGMSTEDLKPYWDIIMGSNRFFLLDHWGSTGEDNLMSKIRYMAKAMDCKWIVLDHLSIVVSAQDNGDERKAIDAIMTKLRTLVQELGIGLFLVSHLKRSSGQSHEEGGRVSLSELRGSQSIAQLSDIVIGLERDQQHEDEETRNTTVIRVLKNRYTGLTGPACYLHYNRFTGRMSEVAKPTEVIDSDF
jgi:twinkle protein